ncbi:hypothetical protein A1O7_10075 [Cladophialophora yegresii CBS 114405]|uniref:Uncharacterized protein n=1 Tax=Cladophialophora yegresii CBS 114405 TaxID=1182544 RepID=W9W861_9EURO|nr:uncharacterized protein A1O7_10075 [Cladophialophora yegresii CBS 114405]EXJ54734.1 hypothetical protein A1O7_10075 [Cladophialophora yegresii CBS 114405]
MAAPVTHGTLSYEQQEVVVFAERERRANTRPSWSYLAKSALPEVYRQAQRLLQEQYRHEAKAEERTTINEKWAVVEAQIRETMIEEMATLDALGEHVRCWTVCDPAAIEKSLEDATTEQERLDVVLGSRIQLLLKGTQGTFSMSKQMEISDAHLQTRQLDVRTIRGTTRMKV